MAEENDNKQVNNTNNNLINLNIEYIELTEDNIKDINKYTNFDDYKFLSNFIKLMREFKDKDKYLYYVFNAIEELDIISLYGQNDERISFITKNDDNYRLIFEIIDNPLIKLKIIKTLYTIHDNKNNDYKSKNIRTYIQYLQSNWKLYLPYFNSDKHIYTEVFTDLIYLLQKTGSKDSYNNLIEKLIDEYCNFDISNYKINMYVDLFINVDKKYNERIYNKLILYINNVIDNNIIDSYYHAEQASVIARKFCKINSDKYWDTYILEADINIKQTEQDILDEFKKADLLTNAFLIYRNIHKKYRTKFISDKQMNKLIIEIRKLRKEGLNNMNKFYITVDNINDNQAYIHTHMKNKSFQDAMSFFTSINNIANFNDLFNSSQKFAKEKPFLFSVGVQPINELAQVKKSHSYDINKSEYENYLYAIIQENIRTIEYKINYIIEPSLNILLDEHSKIITRKFIYEICYNSFIGKNNKTLIDEQHMKLIVEGLYLGFKKKFVIAIHILIPQIEYILRTILDNYDINCVHINNDGTDTYKTLNTFLSEEYRVVMWEIIGPHIYIDLKTLLDDEKGGLNLRNDLSHGLLSYDECNSVYSIYLWWLVLTWFYFLYKQNKK